METYIIENGEQYDLSLDQAALLTKLGLIYPCEDEGCAPYHVANEFCDDLAHTFAQFDQILGGSV